MQRRQYLAWLLGETCIGFFAISSTGCGTLMYPERRHQPHSPFIDWKVVALDGLGLILFFIPGVVAFIVDFYTGAIYLPLEQAYPSYGAVPPVLVPPLGQEPASPGLQRVALKKEELQIDKIEQVVSRHVGRPVVLDSEESRVSQLTELDHFDQHLRQHHADRNFGERVRNFFSLAKFQKSTGLQGELR